MHKLNISNQLLPKNAIDDADPEFGIESEEDQDLPVFKSHQNTIIDVKDVEFDIVREQDNSSVCSKKNLPKKEK